MKVAIIGCGVVGSIFAKHFSKNMSVILYDRFAGNSKKLAEELKAEVANSAQNAVESADIILLAIKPFDFSGFADEVGDIWKGKTVISSMTGIEVETIENVLPQAQVIRIMPNIAMKYGEGVIGLVRNMQFDSEFCQTIEKWLSGLGFLVWVAEEKIDALTALTGSGPAFVLMIIEAFVEAGIKVGFSAKEAQDLVPQMMKGALALLEEEKRHPAEIKWQITSAGGTTIAGLEALEKNRLRAAIYAAIVAAYERSREIR